MCIEAIIRMYIVTLCMEGCHDLQNGGAPACLAYWDVVSMAAAAICRAASAADCAMLLGWSAAPDCWDMMPVQHGTKHSSAACSVECSAAYCCSVSDLTRSHEECRCLWRSSACRTAMD